MSSTSRKPAPSSRLRRVGRVGMAASRLLLAAAAGLALAPSAGAQTFNDPRIDRETGRDIAVYPPDRLFDFLHMKLEVSIPDMSVPEFDAVSTITLTPISLERSSVTLDAGPGMTFASITLDGAPVEFSHDKENERLTITFQRPLAVGKVGTLVMTYHAVKAGGAGKGLTWSKDDTRTPEEDQMFHSQGQPETNHLWFPCHDFPNERLTTEVVVTIPKGFDAVSNGRLLEVKKFPDGRTRLHWLQDKPHTNYLVSLLVGKFDVVNVGGPDTARTGLWMPVYGPIGSGDRLRESFKATPEMVAMCEKLFDEPYPWDKYSQAFARDFAAGAMENTSATTFAPMFIRSPASFLEATIVHELCHQWFGDLVAYKGWEHTWLGEGWANYSEALWAEHKGGADAYQDAVLSKRGSETRSERSFPRFAGMVTNRYSEPDDRFMQVGRDWVYDKGGFVLHMLRRRLGDDVFWKGVALYIDRYKYSCAETDDFRRALEDASGQSLERFFDQWIRRPGYASVSLDYSWNEAEKTLTVVAEQTQKIDGDNPAFALALPLDVKLGEGKWDTVYVEMDTRKVEASFRLDAKPSTIVVDPELTLLMRQRIRQPLEAWIDAARTGRTLYARLQAAEELARMDDPAARSALTALLAASDPEGLLHQTASDGLAAMDLRAAAARDVPVAGVAAAALIPASTHVPAAAHPSADLNRRGPIPTE